MYYYNYVSLYAKWRDLICHHFVVQWYFKSFSQEGTKGWTSVSLLEFVILYEAVFYLLLLFVPLNTPSSRVTHIHSSILTFALIYFLSKEQSSSLTCSLPPCFLNSCSHNKQKKTLLSITSCVFNYIPCGCIKT